MEPMLFKGGRPTLTYYAMKNADRLPEGVSVTRIGRNSDWQMMQRIVKLGWMEKRRTGPRGGIRYHLTVAGRAKLNEAKGE